METITPLVDLVICLPPWTVAWHCHFPCSSCSVFLVLGTIILLGRINICRLLLNVKSFHQFKESSTARRWLQYLAITCRLHVMQSCRLHVMQCAILHFLSQTLSTICHSLHCHSRVHRRSDSDNAVLTQGSKSLGESLVGLTLKKL